MLDSLYGGHISRGQGRYLAEQQKIAGGHGNQTRGDGSRHSDCDRVYLEVVPIYGGAIDSSNLSCKRKAVLTPPEGREGFPVFHCCCKEETTGIGVGVGGRSAGVARIQELHSQRPHLPSHSHLSVSLQWLCP